MKALMNEIPLLTSMHLVVQSWSEKKYNRVTNTGVFQSIL